MERNETATLEEKRIQHSGEGADGSRRCPDYLATRYEVTQLAKHWLRRDIEMAWNDFTTGWLDMDAASDVDRRLTRIRTALGSATMQRAEQRIMDEFQSDKDDELWEAFEDYLWPVK